AARAPAGGAARGRRARGCLARAGGAGQERTALATRAHLRPRGRVSRARRDRGRPAAPATPAGLRLVTKAPAARAVAAAPARVVLQVLAPVAATERGSDARAAQRTALALCRGETRWCGAGAAAVRLRRRRKRRRLVIAA